MEKNVPIVISRAGNGFEVIPQIPLEDQKAICATKKALLAFVDRHFAVERTRKEEGKE